MIARVSCRCEKCASACRGVPGWWAPGGMEASAAELGMSVADFIREHVSVDYYDGPGGDPDVLALCPRRENDGDSGTHDAGGPVDSPCRLLGPGGCRLSLEARPVECAEYLHGDANTLRERLVDEWRGADQETLRALRASRRKG